MNGVMVYCWGCSSIPNPWFRYPLAFRVNAFVCGARQTVASLWYPAEVLYIRALVLWMSTPRSSVWSAFRVKTNEKRHTNPTKVSNPLDFSSIIVPWLLRVTLMYSRSADRSPITFYWRWQHRCRSCALKFNDFSLVYGPPRAQWSWWHSGW